MQHQKGDIIRDRFHIEGILGRGGVGITYRATDLKTQKIVALKALSFSHLQDWKSLDLFEREAKILKQLSHPQIPRYIDYFQIDIEGDRGFYIVQQFLEGKSLAELVAEGWRCREAEAKAIAEQVLNILSYLHALKPAVFHRDIKPQNLIQQTDGTIFLVDFGAVQDTYRQSQIGGSTIVGTYGYMPLEQYRGKAYPATDLYSLGATLLYILSGISPADFPSNCLKIEFRSSLNLSFPFAAWLDRMLEPTIEDRFSSATEALRSLTSPLQNSVSPLPIGSQIEFKRTRTTLEITIPPGGFNFLRISHLAIAIAAIASLGSLTGILLFRDLTYLWQNLPILFTDTILWNRIIQVLLKILCLSPFWWLICVFFESILDTIFLKTSLKIDRNTFIVTHQFFIDRQRKYSSTKDILKVDKSSHFLSRYFKDTELILHYYTRAYKFVGGTLNVGNTVEKYKFAIGRTKREQTWLKQEIEDFIKPYQISREYSDRDLQEELMARFLKTEN